MTTAIDNQPKELWWFDDNAKHTLEQRIREGIAAYVERFGHPPNVVYVSGPEMLTVKELIGKFAVAFKTHQRIRPDNYHITREAVPTIKL